MNLLLTGKKKSGSSRKSGFSSIFLVIILGSIMSLILAAASASYVKASGSAAENLCVVTGRSILSEYNRKLSERYGIFALRASEEKLEALADFYTGSHSEKSDMFLKVSPVSTDINTEEYCALDCGLFMEQINSQGKVYAAETLLKSADLGWILDRLGDISLGGGTSLSDIREALESVEISKAEGDGAEGGEGALTGEGADSGELSGDIAPPAPEPDPDAEALEDLKRDLRDSTECPDYETEEDDEKQITAAMREELPSGLLDIKPRSLLLISGGISGALEGFFANEYIISCCSYAAEPEEKCWLKAECEYVLFGHDTDSRNLAAFKRSLFFLRMAIDLAENLRDPEKLAEYESAAASLPFIPLPAAVSALAAIDAGREAKADVSRVCSGGRAGLAGTETFGTYRDYLLVFLCLLPAEEKAARLMDVIQINMNKMENTGFCFRDYAFGFRLKTEFAHGTIEQEHVYR